MNKILSKNEGKNFKEELIHNYSWLKIAGILLVISSLCIGFFLFQFHTPFIFHIGFVIAAVIMFIHAFKFWKNKWIGASLHFANGLLYTFIIIIYVFNIYYLLNYVLYILLISFVIIGFFRFRISIVQGITYYGWGWTFLCGMINLILALFLTIQKSPLTMIIPLTISIDLFFTGVALFMLGLGASRLKVYLKHIHHPTKY